MKLLIRRLTSGKGRTVIEIKGLPVDKNWCKGLAKDLKKKIGVGGSFKNDFIEIHGENFEQVAKFLNSKKIFFKEIGGLKKIKFSLFMCTQILKQEIEQIKIFFMINICV